MKKQSTDERIKTGQCGERAAIEFLIQHNYRIIEQNWRCRSGELDIIATDDHAIIFIEVRTRRNKSSFGTAAESVDYRKQKKVRETAQVYLHLHGKHEQMIRFDVITVILNESDEVRKLEHILEAF